MLRQSLGASLASECSSAVKLHGGRKLLQCSGKHLCQISELTAKRPVSENGLCMAVARPMATLVLSDEEVQQLQSIATSRSLLHSIVQGAQIVFGLRSR
jgi:hypothetical protein